jgi:phage terminase Nu1 subunit (DNA packaging protein)
MSQAVKQAEFAALLGVNRSTVTRWKKDGRLVMAGGLVDVEASRRAIADSSGGREDVKARHESYRHDAIAAAPGPSPQAAPEKRATAPDADATPAATEAVAAATPPAIPWPEGVETRSMAQARKETAAANLLEMEMAQKRGELIARNDVDAALKFVGATLRGLLDVFPDQIAPQVAPIMSLEECHAQLGEACRNVLVQLGEAIERQKAALDAAAAGATLAKGIK